MIAACVLFTCLSPLHAQTRHAPMKILIHLTHGTENPTIASLAFLVARTAVEEGHHVDVFLAGDAVNLMRDGTIDLVTGIGTGKLREHYEAIVKGRGRFWLSGMSSKARGMQEGDFPEKPVQFAPPSTLLELAINSDKMFVY